MSGPVYLLVTNRTKEVCLMSLSDSHHARRMVAGACMVLAPLFLLVAAVIHPGFETDEAAQLAVVAASRDAFVTAELVGLASIVLAIPAVLGLMHMLREREVAAGHVGGALALLGLVAFAVVQGISLTMWQMTAAGADQAQMAGVMERMTDSTVIFIAVWLMTFAFPVGMIALAGGLVRARAVSPISAACLALGGIAVAVAAPLGAVWVLIAGAALLVAGFGSIGTMVLRETDVEWEHTPEFHGFRAAGGAPSA